MGIDAGDVLGRGDVEAVAEYGRLAQRLGWPTSYAALPGWDEWGLDVRAWLLDRPVAETDARLQELEGMRQGALL